MTKSEIESSDGSMIMTSYGKGSKADHIPVKEQ